MTELMAQALLDAGGIIANLKRDLADAKTAQKWAETALWLAVCDIAEKTGQDIDREQIVGLQDTYIQRAKYRG